MTFSASFFARGIPKPQPRPRAAFLKTKSGKPMARVFDAGTAEAWKGDIVRAGASQRPERPLEGPVYCAITFYLPRPKRLMRKKDSNHPMWHTSKPDRDNLEKAALDALTADGWWRDDSQVVAGNVSKMYHAKDGVPGAEFSVMELGGEAK